MRSFNIPWKAKAFLFWLLSALKASWILPYLSKYITRRSLLTINKEILYDIDFHRKNIQSKSRLRILEIGAGKSILQNIMLSRGGLYQLVVDRDVLIDYDLVNCSIEKKTKLNNFDFPKVYSRDELLSRYNIDYRAPYSIANLEKLSIKFDCFISTNTFEHIPFVQIVDYMDIMKTVLKRDAYLSIIIDYSDHYSHTDKNISKINFLKFSNKTFERFFNTEAHYQNRLRHVDYKNIFTNSGFEVIFDKAKYRVEPPKTVSSIKRQRHDLDFFTKGYFLLKNSRLKTK
jgi:hypothetical protein